MKKLKLVYVCLLVLLCLSLAACFGGAGEDVARENRLSDDSLSLEEAIQIFEKELDITISRAGGISEMNGGAESVTFRDYHKEDKSTIVWLYRFNSVNDYHSGVAAVPEMANYPVNGLLVINTEDEDVLDIFYSM